MHVLRVEGSADDDNRTRAATGDCPEWRPPRRDRTAIPLTGRAANALILGLDAMTKWVYIHLYGHASESGPQGMHRLHVFRGPPRRSCDHPALRPGASAGRTPGYPVLAVNDAGRRRAAASQPRGRPAGMERTTLTRNLKPLIDAGLIGVEHGDDRRVRTIFITAKGHRAAVAALPDWRTAQRNVASQLSPAVFDSLANVTQRLSSTRTRTKSAQQRQAKETRK